MLPCNAATIDYVKAASGLAALAIAALVALEYASHLTGNTRDRLPRAFTRYRIGSADEASKISSLVLSSDERYIIIAETSLLLKQYDITGGGKECSLTRTWKSQHNAPILIICQHRAISLVADLDQWATASADFTVKIWDLSLQYCIFTLKSSNAAFTSLLIGFKRVPAGSGDTVYCCAAGDVEGGLHVWNLSKISKKRLDITRSAHSSHITAITAWDPDNGFKSTSLTEPVLLTCSRDQTLTVWDRSNWTALKTFPLFESVTSVIIVDNGCLPRVAGAHLTTTAQYFLTAGEEGKLKLWDVSNGRLLSTTQCSTDARTREIDQLYFCSGAKCYCVVTSGQNILMIDGRSLALRKQLIGYNEEILDLALCGSRSDAAVADNLAERYLAVATISADLRLYDRTLNESVLLHGHTDSILAIDSPRWDPSLIATASKDNSIRLWKVTSDATSPVSSQSYRLPARAIAIATGHTGAVSSIAFSKTSTLNGFFISAGYDRAMKLWRLPDSTASKYGGGGDSEMATLTALCTIIAHEDDITSIDISPNDKLVVSASLDKSARLWTVDTSKKGCFFTKGGVFSGHKRGIWDACFSPTDQVVATASGDCTIKLFSVVDQSCLKTFEGHPSAVLQVSFLNGGHQLISGDSGGLMKLWNIKTTECMKTIEFHDDKVWAMRYSSDEQTLITGSADCRIVEWLDETEELGKLADEKRAKEIAEDQQLSNLISSNRYKEALTLALTMNRPFTAFNVIQEMMTAECDGKCDVTWMREAISSIDIEQTGLLLDYVAQWNSNTKNAMVAQRVANEVLRIYTPAQLMAIPNIKSFLEAFLPYSRRHFDRLTLLRQQCSILDYTWHQIKSSSD